MEVPEAYVRRLMGKPEVPAQIETSRDERREVVQRSLDAAALEAVRTLRWAVENPLLDGGIRVRAACALLDRAGFAPVEAIEVRQRQPEGAAPIDLRTTEGREQIVDALTELPPRLLEEALARRRTVAEAK